MARKIENAEQYESALSEARQLMNSRWEYRSKSHKIQLHQVISAISKYEKKQNASWLPDRLGERMEWKMIQKGIRPRELAEQLDISKGKLFKIFRGRRRPRVDLLIYIRNILDIEADFLLNNA